MISASEFLKWLYVFKVPFGPNVITIPVSLAQGGTGGALSPNTGGVVFMNGSVMAYTNVLADGVVTTDAGGLPQVSTTLPAGLTIPDYLPLAGGTMTGDLFLNGMPLTDLQAATKEYVDDVAAGLAPTGPVQAATTAALDTTYFNGPANDGKGATLTMNTTGVVTLDGIDVVAGQDYMIKNQINPAENGIYDCTTAGAIGVAAVFTRSTTFDTPIAINKAGITPILEGDTLAGQGWYEVNTVNNIGTDPIVFIKFGNTGTVTSITAGTGLTGGVITTSGTVALDIPVSVVHGGTGLTTTTGKELLYSIADNIIAGLATINNGFLTTNSTGIPSMTSLANIQNCAYSRATDIGTLNAYAMNPDPAVPSFVTALRLLMLPTSTNTDAATVNISGLGAIPITANGQPLSGGEIANARYADMVYNALTNSMELQNSQLLKPLNYNYVIGGNFDTNLWQRGTSFPSQANAGGQYNADMFYFALLGGGTGTVAQVADAPTLSQCGIVATNSMRFTVTTADASIASNEYYNFGYCIEGYDWAKLAQKPFTLDFWVKATVTGTYCVGFTNTAGDRTYPVEYTVNVSNTWEHKQVSISASPSAGTWNYTNGRGLIIVWSIAAGSNYYGTANTWNTGSSLFATANQVNGMATIGNLFALDLVQVCAGNEFYPWLGRPVEVETALQQRYYTKSYGIATAPGTTTGAGAVETYVTLAQDAPFSVRFPVPMRATPTMTVFARNGTSGQLTGYISGTNAGTTVVVSTSNLTTTGFLNMTAASGLAATTSYFGHYTADASL